MPEMTEKLNTLFHNPDAVLQHAGFKKTPGERNAMGGCYVSTMQVSEESQHEEALKNPRVFCRNLDVRDREVARDSLLEKFHITNDGTHIFDLPKL